MRGILAALTLGFGSLAALPAAAQSAGEGEQAAEQSAGEPITAEEVIEVARERLRPPGVRRPCKLPETPNEIVVCARDPDANRVESPTDEALRTGQPGKDSIPRAPDLVPPCTGVCMRMGATPVHPLIVDLTHMPEGLSEEDAALVYRVEDGPPREMPPEPAAAP